MRRVDFWYEFASTYSHPAAARIEELADIHGVTISWQPFLLGPILKQLGWSTSPFNLQHAKGRYMWHDVARTCQLMGLPPLKRPSKQLDARQITKQFNNLIPYLIWLLRMFSARGNYYLRY